MKKKYRSTGQDKIIIIMAVLGIALVLLFLTFLMEGITGQTSKQEEETSAEDVITLDLVYAYQNPQWNSAMEALILEFEETYPEIDIDYEVSYEDSVYEDVLSAKIARDELGDLVQLKTPAAYAESGLLGEISEEVAALVTTTYTSDGTVYGVGMVESTWGILYNRAIFEEYGLEEPETYEDFLSLCRTLKRKGITPIGVGGSDLWHMEYWVNHFFNTDVLSVDADWLTKCLAGEVSWTDEEPQQMISHLCGLFSSGYINENWLTTTDTSLAYKMTEGEIAMIYTGPWTAAAVQKLDSEMDLGWFYLPDEEGTVYASDHYDVYWSVTTDCAQDEQKYEAAMTFLSFFYSQDVYRELCTTTYNLSLLSENEETETMVDALMEEVLDDLAGVDAAVETYIGNEETPEGFEKRMLETVQEILSGERTAEEGLEEIQAIWEECSGEVAIP